MKKFSSLGGLEPPTFRLTAERANRLRHRDSHVKVWIFKVVILGLKLHELHDFTLNTKLAFNALMLYHFTALLSISVPLNEILGEVTVNVTICFI